jgi:hypothetical protein
MNWKNIIDHPKTTVVGFLIAVIIAAPILEKFDFAHASIASVCGLIGAVATALLGAFLQDPQSKAPLGVLLVALLMPATLIAQTAADPIGAQPPAAGISFSTSSEAVAFYSKGVWTAGNDTTEVLSVASVGKHKTNDISVIGKEIIASDFTSYLGGFRFEPDLSGFLAKTQIPVASFRVFVDAGVGTSMLPANTSAVTWLAGGGARYALNSSGSLQWTTITADYVRVGNQNVTKISTGLQYFFHKAS